MSPSRRRDEPAKRRGGGFNLFGLLGSLARPRAVARVESRPYAQPTERRLAPDRDEPAKRRGGGFNLFGLLFGLLGSLVRPRAVARAESRPYAQPTERRLAPDPAWPDPAADDRAEMFEREHDTWDDGDDRAGYEGGPVHYGDDAEPRWEDTRDHYLAVHNLEKSFGGRKVVKGVS